MVGSSFSLCADRYVTLFNIFLRPFAYLLGHISEKKEFQQDIPEEASEIR